ncbi:hypothetical protein D3C80_1167320 [compost metagenome]
MQAGLGEQVLDLFIGQVMVNHGQAQPVQLIIDGAGLALWRDDHRQIIGIGLAQHQLGVSGFKAVGAAEQVNGPGVQGGDRLFTAAEAAHFNRDAQQFADQAGIVGGQPFILAVADIDIEGRVIRAGGPQAQQGFFLQPAPVSRRQGYAFAAND